MPVLANVPSRDVHRDELNAVHTKLGLSPARGRFGRQNEIGQMANLIRSAKILPNVSSYFAILRTVESIYTQTYLLHTYEQRLIKQSLKIAK